MFGRLIGIAALAALVSPALTGGGAAQAVCGVGLGTATGGGSFACGQGAEAYGGSTSIGTAAGWRSGLRLNRRGRV